MDYYIFDYSSWELAPTLYPNFSKGHFTLQEESFYHGYLLCFTLLPKRTRGPTLGFILHSEKNTLLFWAIAWALFMHSFLFGPLEYGLISISLLIPNPSLGVFFGFPSHWAFGYELQKLSTIIRIVTWRNYNFYYSTWYDIEYKILIHNT